MEELNLGEIASWIAKVESNKLHLLINTSYSIVGTVKRRELVTEKKWQHKGLRQVVLPLTIASRSERL